MSFSETLLDHFRSPRNVGEVTDADAEAEGENPVCGDRLRISARIEHGVLCDVRWRAEGCAPTVAAASVASEMLRGMTVEQARALDSDALCRELGGLPARKDHAPALVVTTVTRALRAWESSQLQEH